METLIRISRITGKQKYLDPVPRALAYLRRSLLPDGRVARYYELKTNKPLYMDARYQLTYDDGDAPSHYGWKQEARLDRIEKQLKGEASETPAKVDVARIVSTLDGQGRWISTYDGEGLVGQPKFARGFTYLSSAVFSRNLEALAAALK